MNEFPELPVKPGDYACTWFLDNDVRAGQIELSGNRFPRVDLFDDNWGASPGSSTVHSFRQSHDLPRLVGKMRSNLDVVLVDARIEFAFPNWAFGRARLAIVGLGVDRITEDRYDAIVLQVTGAERFFGASPIKDLTWPSKPSNRAEQRYSVLLNPASRWRWRNRTEQVAIVCGYQRRFPVRADRFELLFAPVIEFTAQRPLTLDEWIARWVQPLIDVVSLACGEPQRLAWLTVRSGADREETSGVVFGGGIAQEPYQAGYDDEWRRAGLRPLFTLASLPGQLPTLLRRWRNLQGADDPFVALYRLVLLDPELPPRAQYLYLVQALEALHGHEKQVTEDRAQRRFTRDRKKLLREVEQLGMGSDRLRFLRNNWSERRRISLASRLSDLVKSVPPGVRSFLKRPEMAAIAKELATEHGVTVLHEQLATLRNDLSHGRRSYADADLKPWVECLDVLCRARLLRLLGFGDPAIERALSEDSS
jgi:hypothetical protein